MQTTGKHATRPRTMVEKIWDDHVIVQQNGIPDLIYIDLHLLHEVTSPQAFADLTERGLLYDVPVKP